MSDIDFKDQVAVVTGAGGGLGRSYAIDLAKRGAKVVVNDLGGDTSGQGNSSSPAESVVEEIKAFGGEAMANAGNVADAEAMQAMADAAIDRWGQVDIFIANAGILRDRTFSKGTLQDFRDVIDVHLMGTVNGIKAVWESMKEHQYGRIIVTTSAAGLYGNFGQTNYAAAKMGLIGLMNALKLEGHNNGIHVNAIAPGAATRMTDGLMPDAIVEKMSPDSVAPGVVFLCSKDAPSGIILNAQGGHFSVCAMHDSAGLIIDDACAEDLRDHWAEVADPSQQTSFASVAEQAASILERVGN